MSSNGAGTPILEVGDIHTYYGSIHALKGVSLTVNEGEIVTLLGANGAGKTTTLRSINGLNRPRQGTIRFQGRDITTTAPHEIVKRGIAQSPEGRRLFPRMSVTENLEMGAFQRNDKAEIRADMDRVFELFPRLQERRNQKAGTMSGGEQQMCAIGRALMARPKLLLLDEPSLGLAPIFVERIFDIIRQINEQGTSILLVEQNALMALDAADRGYVLETGRIVLADKAVCAEDERRSSQDVPRRVVAQAAPTRHREVRRRNEVADPLRSAAARHLECRAETVHRHKPELARCLSVAAAGDEDRPEPAGDGVARAPLDERLQRMAGVPGAVVGERALVPRRVFFRLEHRGAVRRLRRAREAPRQGVKEDRGPAVGDDRCVSARAGARVRGRDRRR